MNIILFTHSYPFDFAAEHTFLEREIPYLRQNFERVILIPRVAKGKRFTVPSHVEIEEGFADYYREHSHIASTTKYALKYQGFFQELWNNLYLIFKPFKLIRLFLFSGRVMLIEKWFSNWLETHQVSPDAALIYTYWFDEMTMGLGLVKQKNPQLKLVSRAHGYDIYEEQYFPYYWPFRRKALAFLDKLFTASYDGRDYFRDHYPEFNHLFETAHLGTKDPGFISKASVDNKLRIVSCAHILPLKRIDLLCKGIAIAARIRPERILEWLHFGDGKDRKALQNAVRRSFPSNAEGNLPGYVPNQDIMKYYSENPVDVFVNLSATEGGAPVSIQEAISCGIPVIATNIGGNPEIVSERNGLLLNPDPTAEEVAQALLKMCDDREMASKMRLESRRVWEESFNAEVNFRTFAERLKSIRQGYKEN